ncbi:MAG: hypothetical protein GF315_10565 [candidate division Zixibacteria bacterium]|nr:hypothetical protein [candidate division Zixibacteria bacterium]
MYSKIPILKYSVCLILLTIILSGTFPLVSGNAQAALKWYQYYENGVDYFNKGDWVRALNEFSAAASLEFEEKKRKRTYGMHFIEYYPHRYMAKCYYRLGKAARAEQELELSLAFQPTKEAKRLKESIDSGEIPEVDETVLITPVPGETELAEDEKKYQEELKRLQEEREKLARAREEDKLEQEEKIRKLEEKLRREREKKKGKYYSTYGKIPTGALTYDPDQVTQVGSRLSIAVMKFSYSGEGRDLSDDVLNEMITNLYSLGGRFNIIEREKMQKIMEEQMRSQTGVIDEETAVEAGRILGVDAVLIGNISRSGDNSVKIWARLINTQTGQLITAQDSYAMSTYPEDINQACMDMAIKIYNDLPLVEGYVMSVEGDDKIFLDIGREKHMKPDMQCVVYREGEKIKHPVTGDVAYVKKIYLGEAVLSQVQDSGSIAEVIVKEKGEKINIGDKVVIK